MHNVQLLGIITLASAVKRKIIARINNVVIIKLRMSLVRYENMASAIAGGWLNFVNEMNADTKRTLAARESSDCPKAKCKIAVTTMTAIYETSTDDGFENLTLCSKIIK